MGLFDKFKKQKNEDAPSSDNEKGVTEKFSQLVGDRGLPNVNGKSGISGKKIFLFLILVVVTIVSLSVGGTVFLKNRKDKNIVIEATQSEIEQYQRSESSNKEALAELKRQQERKNKKSLNDVINEVKDDQAHSEREREKETQDVPPIVLPPPEPQSSSSNGEGVMTPKQRRLQGDILIADNHISVPENKKTGLDNRHESGSENDFLQGARFEDGKVGFIHNRKYLLSAGTSMPCVLKTKIVTSYPAVVMCQLTKNVYSDDGQIILIRAGALLQGEQTRALQKGVARVFVNWSTVKDNNVRVRIDALAADGLGASGLPAWIDNHFWERFGGAIMLSFIDDALAAAASHASKGSNTLKVDNTKDTAGNMAELALENSINIPPTAYVNQGEMLSVIVPRNIDFSSIYRVE